MTRFCNDCKFYDGYKCLSPKNTFSYIIPTNYVTGELKHKRIVKNVVPPHVMRVEGILSKIFFRPSCTKWGFWFKKKD